MRIAFSVVLFALIGSIIVLFYQQGRINELQNELNEEKKFFDARFGEVVRLTDEIGEYKDSCFVYRKRIEELVETNEE
jgi:hypothetical protein